MEASKEITKVRTKSFMFLEDVIDKPKSIYVKDKANAVKRQKQNIKKIYTCQALPEIADDEILDDASASFRSEIVSKIKSANCIDFA